MRRPKNPQPPARDRMAEAATIIDLLKDGGAALLALVKSADSSVFAVAEAAAPGTKLPMLLGLAAGESLPAPAQQMLQSHYPDLKKWQDRGMVDYLYRADKSGSSRWLETMKALPRDEDDALLLKMVILSEDARTIVPFMISLGYTPSAAIDAPFTLAVMLGKEDIFNTLANNGADIYAHDAEAFKVARARGIPETVEALDMLCELSKARFMRKFVSQFSDGVTLEKLRAPRAEDNGDCGLMTAAKAGVLPGLIKAGVLDGMGADDFLQVNRSGATPAAVLLAQNTPEALFDATLWSRDGAGAQKLWAALPDDARALTRAAFYDTQQGVIAAENRARLGKNAKSFKLQ